MLAAQSFGNFWDYWDATLGDAPWQVWFDGDQKLIQIHEGVTTLNVQIDIYSVWKEWMAFYDNAKYLEALASVGGDPITDTESLGDTYFLKNGWRIRPWSGDYELTILGNLYVEGGSGNITVNPEEDSNIITRLQTSILVSKQVETNDVVVEVVNQAVIDALAVINNTTANTNATVETIPEDVWSHPVEGLTDKTTIGGFVYKKLLSVIKFLAFK